MRHDFWRLGLTVLALVGMLAGCAPAAGDSPAAVTDAGDGGAVAQEAEAAVFAEGVVEPARSVVLRAAVGGLLTEVPVAEGDAVTAGTVLALVDPTDADLAIRRAEATLAQAEARLAEAKAGTRDEQLAALAAQIDIADAAVAQAAAERDAVAAGLAQADVLEAQADLLEAEIAHDQADDAHGHRT